MIRDLLSGGSNETETETEDSEATTVTGEPYDITETGYTREGGQRVISHTEDGELVAGPAVRDLIESGYENPESALWVGYDDDPQMGFREGGIPFNSLFQHLWIAGVSGAGKTTEMNNWQVQLAFSGHGFVYFDPKGKDSRELLRKLPEHRLEDVVWIEPGTDRDREIGLNLLDVPETDSDVELETAIEDRITNLKAALAANEELYATMEAVTESMGRAMMQSNADPDGTDFGVVDFFFILLNERRREDFAENNDDPYVGEFLDVIAEMPDDEIWPLLKRVKRWTENGVIRRIIARRESTIDWRDIIENDRIVIVRTPVESKDIKRLTTLTVMRGIWSAVQSRSYETHGHPDPYFVLADEFDDIASEQLDMQSMLARARSMRLSVTVACQYPSQLEEGALKPLKNNADNLVTFKANDGDDARILMDRFRGYEADDLLETKGFRVWTRLPLGAGDYSEPLKLKTFAPYPPLRSEEAAEEIIEESLERYGEEPLTDAEIQRELPYGDMEDLDDYTHDLSERHVQLRALKAIYDESLRQDSEGDYIPIKSCVPRIRRYLINTDGVPEGAVANTDHNELWRRCLQHIPEHELSWEGETNVKVEDRAFLSVGETQNDGGRAHFAPMKDAYAPLTKLGFVMDIINQDGSALPDAQCSLEDVLDVPDGASPGDVHSIVEEYKREHSVLSCLAGASTLAIESEHSTGGTQPSQTVANASKIDANQRCLFLCRPDVASNVYNTLLEDPQGYRTSHPKDGERRFYTTSELRIDGETMTRPGGRENVWVEDESTGEIILRDKDGVEHARFDSLSDALSDSSAYPGGERTVTTPVKPEFDPEDVDVVVVPEGASEVSDLSLFVPDDDNVPLDELDGVDEQETDTSPTQTDDLDVPDNAARLFDLLRDEGDAVTISEAHDLATNAGDDRLDVSRKTVSNWVNALVDEGVLVEGEYRQRGGIEYELVSR